MVAPGTDSNLVNPKRMMFLASFVEVGMGMVISFGIALIPLLFVSENNRSLHP